MLEGNLKIVSEQCVIVLEGNLKIVSEQCVIVLEGKFKNSIGAVCRSVGG